MIFKEGGKMKKKTKNATYFCVSNMDITPKPEKRVVTLRFGFGSGQFWIR